jgi:hypothetical protein
MFTNDLARVLVPAESERVAGCVARCRNGRETEALPLGPATSLKRDVASWNWGRCDALEGAGPHGHPYSDRNPLQHVTKI